MAILIGVQNGDLAGGLIPDGHGIGLIKKNSGVINALDGPEIRDKSGVRPQQGAEREIYDEVRVSVQTALIVDVEPVCNGVGKLVVAGAVVRILEALCAHAHDDSITFAVLVTPE